MQATTRQLEYVRDRSKRAGKEVDEAKLRGLSKEQASSIIEMLQEGVAETDTQTRGTSRARINDTMFGLAAKLVWQHALKTDEPPMNSKFNKKVITVYKRLTQAKQELREELAEGSQ